MLRVLFCIHIRHLQVEFHHLGTDTIFKPFLQQLNQAKSLARLEELRLREQRQGANTVECFVYFVKPLWCQANAERGDRVEMSKDLVVDFGGHSIEGGFGQFLVFCKPFERTGEYFRIQLLRKFLRLMRGHRDRRGRPVQRIMSIMSSSSRLGWQRESMLFWKNRKGDFAKQWSREG